jgi:hypothetical protein
MLAECSPISRSRLASRPDSFAKAKLSMVASSTLETIEVVASRSASSKAGRLPPAGLLVASLNLFCRVAAEAQAEKPRL